MNPEVSILTPTFNRHVFLNKLKEFILNQTYPLEKVEWLIYDDSDCDKNISDDILNLSFVKYYKSKQKINIGEKRNFLNDKCNGDFIICMDDDDYYPPERIEYAVNELKNSKLLIAGSNILYIYHSNLKKISKFNPYKTNHCINNSLSYKKEYLNNHKYLNVSFGEEQHFLKNFTEPLIHLDPFKTVLCIGHSNNTIQKKEYIPTNLKLSYFIKDRYDAKDPNEKQNIIDYYLKL